MISRKICPVSPDKWKAITLLFIFAVLVLPSITLAASGGKPATKIYNVADTRGMEPGLSKWIADIYNNNLWLFGTLIVVMMGGMGLIIGLGMDKLVALLGINLGKLDHHE
jgi:hypothetical protein